jgi:hypothetical protein
VPTSSGLAPTKVSSSKISIPAKNVKDTSNKPVKPPINHNYDIAFYGELVKGMDDLEICKIIKNVFKPDESYVFPKTNGRSFRCQLLKIHS